MNILKLKVFELNSHENLGDGSILKYCVYKEGTDNKLGTLINDVLAHETKGSFVTAHRNKLLPLLKNLGGRMGFEALPVLLERRSIFSRKGSYG